MCRLHLYLASQTFLSAGEYSHSLLRSCAGKVHELLIIGWKLTAFGEVWLAKPLNGQVEPIRVAFGQFGIDNLVLAPKKSFENTPWQPKPFFEIAQTSDEFLTRPSMEMQISSSEMEELSGTLKGGLIVEARDQREAFVVARKGKVAQSHRYCLTEVKWLKEERLWKVTVAKIN